MRHGVTTCTHTQSTNNNFSLFSSRQAVRKQTDGDRETKEKEEEKKKTVDISQGVDYSLKKKKAKARPFCPVAHLRRRSKKEGTADFSVRCNRPLFLRCFLFRYKEAPLRNCEIRRGRKTECRLLGRADIRVGLSSQDLRV